jgi:hypothetical protein
MTHHLHTTNISIFIIPCKQSTIIKMSETHKYSLTQHHHTHDYSSISMKLPRHGWFQAKASNLVDLNQLGRLATNLFKRKSYWWNFKLGLILWSFEHIWFVHELDLQLVVSERSWEKKTCVPIWRELMKKSSWTKKIHGNPFT